MVYIPNESCTAAFKALSDETRLRIFLTLLDGEKCACQLHEGFDCTQPTISYHMRVLTESGLVESRRNGATTCYSVKPDMGDAVRTLLQLLTDRAEGGEG